MKGGREEGKKRRRRGGQRRKEKREKNGKEKQLPLTYIKGNPEIKVIIDINYMPSMLWELSKYSEAMSA